MRVKWLGQVGYRRSLRPVLVMLAITMAFLGILSDAFLTPQNLQNLLEKTASAQVMACGVTWLLLAGQIDLSGGAVIAAAAVCGLTGMQFFHMSAIGGIFLTVFLGAVLGCFTGFFVAGLRMPSVLITLLLIRMLRGIALYVSGGTNISGISTQYRWLGVAAWNNMLPVSFLVALALALGMQFVLRKTVFGYYVRAIGENSEVATSQGIPVKVIWWKLYVLAGILYGLASVILTGRIGVASSTLADGQELTVLAGVIIGGCSLSGGQGNFLGSFLGVLLLSVIDNGISLLNISSFWLPFLQGVVIFLAVFVDNVFRYRKKEDC